MKTKNLSQKGFTLIELLVVIAIIGILSTIATTSLNTARSRARDAKRMADVSQIHLALYLYYDTHSGFPVDDPVANWESANMVANWANVLRPHLDGTRAGTQVLMKTLPNDPMNKAPYFYGYRSNGTSFVMTYVLEQGGPKTMEVKGE